jgi:hypothetical protein
MRNQCKKGRLGRKDMNNWTPNREFKELYYQDDILVIKPDKDTNESINLEY